jgi:hypothetical protein
MNRAFSLLTALFKSRVSKEFSVHSEEMFYPTKKAPFPALQVI